MRGRISIALVLPFFLLLGNRAAAFWTAQGTAGGEGHCTTCAPEFTAGAKLSTGWTSVSVTLWHAVPGECDYRRDMTGVEHCDEREGCQFMLLVSWQTTDCLQGDWCWRQIQPYPLEWECTDTGQYCEEGSDLHAENLPCLALKTFRARLGTTYTFFNLQCGECTPMETEEPGG